MSSSPSVCESLQSSLDFQPRDSIPSPKSFFSLHKPQYFSNAEEAHYFSKPFLSSRSLEMCTESLGSETGSGIDQFSHLAAATGPENCGAIHHARKQKKPIKNGGGRGGNFPPPLTSISGAGGVQVHTHREGGRLVIKAFASTARSSCFQAERGDGRLRLSLLNDGGDEVEVEENGGGEEGIGGGFWGENVKEEGGKVWANRCNGDRSSRKKRMQQQSLQFCVVGV